MQLERHSNNVNSVWHDGTTVLFSYSTPVAAFVQGRGVLRTKQRHSSTTTRHINEWIKAEFALGVIITEVEQTEIYHVWDK